ncbi:MAG: hypothetical protein K6B14_07790 [Lachnospiraceae bacterium]|nr:hypothetical protein [Lachnospiraceae bacterium]
MKLRGSQKILLLAACLFYAGFLFMFVLGNSFGVLGCSIGMGVMFLAVIAVGLPSDSVDEDDDLFSDTPEGEPEGERVHVNSLIDQLASRREDLENAHSDIKSREEEIEKLHQESEKKDKQMQEINERNSYLSEKVASLEASLKAATNKLYAAEGESNYETILPDAKNDPPKVINIGEAAQRAAADLQEAAGKAGISIRTISTDATLMVKASPTMIDVLFKNIIDNAIKYMSREGTLQITISRIEQELFIVMKDNGEGLAPDETEHIFELNFQGTNRISGNGLGLAQARAIVEYYGGMIYARSSVGSGMGIYIHLPSAV